MSDAKSLKRSSPVQFVTVKLENGLQQPLAFIPHSVEGTVNITPVKKFGIQVEYCSGTSKNCWMVFVGKPCATFEFSEKLREFQLAVLETERASYVMGHTHGVDRDFVHNKYRFTLQEWREPLVA